VEIRAGTPEGALAARDPDTVAGSMDGLLLPGGGDVDPKWYRDPVVHPTVTIEPARDGLEIALCTSALARGMPILGICRGVQLLNVAAGGTLWQDLSALRPGSSRHAEPPGRRQRQRRLHTVKAETETLAAQLLGREPLAVNSIHHQAVRVPATGFRVGALAPDGVIEAVESSTAAFVLGVQWHPEELWDEDARHAALFSGLCRAAVEYARARRTQGARVLPQGL